MTKERANNLRIVCLTREEISQAWIFPRSKKVYGVAFRSTTTSGGTFFSEEDYAKYISIQGKEKREPIS
jgi:hypothetical protein